MRVSISLAATSTLALLLGLGPIVTPSAGATVKRPHIPRAGYSVQLMCGGTACETVSAGRRWRGASRDHWVVAARGQRYSVRVDNPTQRWVEAVITVDGRNILDGHRPGASSRGYLVPPRDHVEIEGWRVDSERVAAFRFTSVGQSYAGQTGSARDAGLIQVAFFPEAGGPIWRPEPHPHPHPCRGGDCRKLGKSSASDHARGVHEAEPRSGMRRPPRPSQNTGTGYGEDRTQVVSERSFTRANRHSPEHRLTIRYDDRAGLRAKGVLTGWR